jgi:hypothetical protein
MTSPGHEAFLSDAPEALSSSLERLLERPAETRENLLAQLSEYTLEIDRAARARKDLDVHLAESILRSCTALLEEGWDDLDEGQQRLAQLACDYYLDAEDEDADLESVFGFEDDAEVLNLVLEEIGRGDLKVRV